MIIQLKEHTNDRSVLILADNENDPTKLQQRLNLMHLTGGNPAFYAVDKPLFDRLAEAHGWTLNVNTIITPANFEPQS